MRVAGVMSGTSLDGIDVAVVETNGRRVRTLGFLTVPYARAVREAILAVSNATTNTAQISRLNFRLGELYAGAVKRAVARYGPVELVGCHGQTIYHEGGKNTLQTGSAAVIAERLGVPVVSDFRSRDIAAGGQGAPLVPFVDYLLFRHPRRARVALNIGGIANITVIPAGASPTDVIAFDTGPGNMVLDALAQVCTEGRQRFDRGGRIAASGTINRQLLARLMRGSYYRKTPPKSAGREQYGAEFVTRLLAEGMSLPDLMATATALTASTIALAVRAHAPAGCELIAAGGGTHNPAIMSQLAALLPACAISLSTHHGIDADAKEAIAFAVLAHETFHSRPANLPSSTGAKHSVVLGSVTA